MADFIVVYDSATLAVFAQWERTTSDNSATWKTDGFLEVDGDHVLDGLDGVGSEITAALISNPTAADAEATVGVFKVDAATNPTDMVEMEATDTDRNTDYEYTI